MRLPLSIARGLVLFGWDCFAAGMDLWACRVAGCDWQWVQTSEGRKVRCARSGCKPWSER